MTAVVILFYEPRPYYRLPEPARMLPDSSCVTLSEKEFGPRIHGAILFGCQEYRSRVVSLHGLRGGRGGSFYFLFSGTLITGSRVESQPDAPC